VAAERHTPLLEDLLEAGADPATLRAAAGRWRVLERDGLRWLHGGGRSIQSVMCLSEPARPVMGATVQLLSALLWRAEPRRVLSLGLGGGAIERYLARHRPGAALTSVESSAEVLALAREHFALPPRCRLCLAEAARFVAGAPGHYDLVFCDLFDGERNADCLSQPDFVARLAGRLAPDGVLAINLSPRSEDELLAVLLPLRTALRWVMLSTRADQGNVVVLASRLAPPDAATVEARAGRLEQAGGGDFAATARRLTRLPVPSAAGTED